MSTMGKRIKSLRESMEYTQEQLGSLIGVSKSTIGMYELDKREPDKERLEALADLFNADMDYIYGKSDFKNKYEWLKSQSVAINASQRRILEKFDQLNQVGKDKAVEYVSDLCENPRYSSSYVPEVIAAHHPTGELDETDRKDISNILKIIEADKNRK